MDDTIDLLLKFEEEKIHDLLIKSLLSHLDIKFTTQRIIYIHENPFGIIVQMDKKNILIISSTKNVVEQIVEKIHQSFKKYSDDINEFGYTLGYYISGKKIVEDWLVKNRAINGIKLLDPKNKLEADIIAHIDKYTNLFLSNIEITFVEPIETFEYDIILKLPKIFLNIEIMDYSSVKDEIREIKNITPLFTENIKSTTLLKSLDKANKLDLNLIILINGFPSDVFNNIKQIATSRGITIIDSNSLDDLSHTIMKEISKLITSKEKTLGNELKNSLENEDIQI